MDKPKTLALITKLERVMRDLDRTYCRSMDYDVMGPKVFPVRDCVHRMVANVTLRIKADEDQRLLKQARRLAKLIDKKA